MHADSLSTEMLADGSKRMHVSRRQFEALSLSLKAFSQTTKCSSVMVVDSSGMLICHAGPLDAGKVGLVATLVAGNYSATAEMARVIGETSGFKTQFLEGKESSLYLAGIDSSLLIAVTFGTHVTFGMVRLQVTKTIEEIRASLAVPEDSQEQIAITAQSVESSEFRSELSSKLDAVLFQKRD